MTKKHLFINPLIVFSLLLAYSSFSQSQDSTTGFRKLQLGVNYSPEISYRALYPVTEYMNGQAPQFSYASGISLGINFNRNVGIEVGVQYSTKSFIEAHHHVSVINEAGHFILLYEKTQTYRFSYVELPVKMNFISGKKKLRLIGSIGLSPALLTSSSLENKTFYTNHTESTHFKPPADRNFNVFSMLSLGIDYKINNRMNLRIQPIFRFGHLWVTNGSYSTYLYSGGINFGLYCGL